MLPASLAAGRRLCCRWTGSRPLRRIANRIRPSALVAQQSPDPDVLVGPHPTERGAHGELVGAAELREDLGVDVRPELQARRDGHRATAIARGGDELRVAREVAGMSV